MTVRILEIARCGECPHLDGRRERKPWDCAYGGLKIWRTDNIHRNCPIEKKREVD